MKKIILVWLIAILPTVMQAQKDYAALLDEYMQAQVTVHDFTGAVLIAQSGKIIYKNGFGFANREWNILNTVETRFQIASLTKQFTAVAIMHLKEQGKLQLKDKLNKYFPDFPKGDSITVHMLLNHTSGIKEYSENPDLFDINPNIPVSRLKETLINTFKNEPFDFTPGTFWKYSNSGYILLGYIIEQVSGQPYQEYIYKNLLQKANMNNSGLIAHDSIIPQYASGYSKNPKGWIKAMSIPINTSFSAGGLFSTVDDLFIWSEALYDGNIISKESLAKINSPNHGDFGAGYGVFVDKYLNHTIFHHQGGTPGFNSFMAKYPDAEINIFILTNRDTNLDFLPKGLAAILFDYNVTPAYKRYPVTIDTSNLKHYTGEFNSPNFPFPLNIIEKDKRLYLSLGRDIELVPESETKFYIEEPDVEIQIEYVFNSSKEITSISIIEAGVKFESNRL